jgi:hypothetical protein
MSAMAGILSKQIDIPDGHGGKSQPPRTQAYAIKYFFVAAGGLGLTPER